MHRHTWFCLCNYRWYAPVLGLFYLVLHNQLLIYELEYGAYIPGNPEWAATDVIYCDLRMGIRGHPSNTLRTQDVIRSRRGKRPLNSGKYGMCRRVDRSSRDLAFEPIQMLKGFKNDDFISHFIHSFTHSSIHSTIQHIFIEHLLSARH